MAEFIILLDSGESSFFFDVSLTFDQRLVCAYLSAFGSLRYGSQRFYLGKIWDFSFETSPNFPQSHILLLTKSSYHYFGTSYSIHAL